MSMIHFMSDPFPDNHNGFDYAPQSESDLHREFEEMSNQANNSKAQNKLMSMFASLLK